MFGGLGLKGQSDGYSVKKKLGSFTEEVTVTGKAVFGGCFKFAVSEVRKKFDNTDSAVQGEEDRSSSPSTQEHQQFEVKINHNSTREQLGGEHRER